MTVRHEVEVDTAIAEAHESLARAERDLERSANGIMHAIDARRTYVRGRATGWDLSLASALVKIVELIDLPATVAWKRREMGEALTRYEDARLAWGEARETLKTQIARYAGWSRFFLVQGGHIHATMAELQKWHAWQHHQYSCSHIHAGENNGPGQRPPGWRTGEDAVFKDRRHSPRSAVENSD